MNNSINFRGAIKLFRKELQWTKDLTDQQYRLYMLYRLQADWDHSHKGTFGSKNLTLKQIMGLLPWSIGKVSEVRRELIEKGYLHCRGNSIEIHSFRLLNLDFRSSEKAIQNSEENLLQGEKSVHSPEKGAVENLVTQNQNNPTNLNISIDTLHSSENSNSTKETLNKINEDEIKGVELEIEKIRAKYTNPFKRPDKRSTRYFSPQ